MYGAHVGGRAVRSICAAPRVVYDRVNGKGSFWGLGGSASLKSRTLTLTVVNPHVTDARETEIQVRGGRPVSVAATTLAASDIHAHNTFDAPDTVRPRTAPAPATTDGGLTFRFPPASVTRLTIEL